MREQNSAVLYDHPYIPDEAGNRTNMRGIAFNYNANNQITNTGYGYDANGNTTLLRGTPIIYDYENRALNYGNDISAVYRPDGLRAWKQPLREQCQNILRLRCQWTSAFQNLPGRPHL